ncbi:MAG: imidazole glycerol phosphate synthase subunit HisH [Acidobacteriota bacterium]|nr:MAG: imidazole glycerol phosphate synthase subunit HisH [Acidobacteriota bacterium]
MIVVIDYKAGNLYNVGHALKYIGAAHSFSGDPDVVSRAEKIILPGVGSASAAMDSLREQGLVEVLKGIDVPFLGICLGLQLLFEASEEDQTECLGIIPGTVARFDREKVKVPHIGWNRVSWDSRIDPRLISGVESGQFFYFVHSYYAPVSSDYSIARTDYDVEFASGVCRNNYYGFQFHPERSGQVGLKLLENFAAI